MKNILIILFALFALTACAGEPNALIIDQYNANGTATKKTVVPVAPSGVLVTDTASTPQIAVLGDGLTLASGTLSADGVPPGGTANQVLTKNSGTNGDFSWKSTTFPIVSDNQTVYIAYEDYGCLHAIAPYGEFRVIAEAILLQSGGQGINLASGGLVRVADVYGQLTQIRAGDPIHSTDLVTKGYADAHYSGAGFPLTGDEVSITNDSTGNMAMESSDKIRVHANNDLTLYSDGQNVNIQSAEGTVNLDAAGGINVDSGLGVITFKAADSIVFDIDNSNAPDDYYVRFNTIVTGSDATRPDAFVTKAQLDAASNRIAYPAYSQKEGINRFTTGTWENPSGVPIYTTNTWIADRDGYVQVLFNATVTKLGKWGTVVISVNDTDVADFGTGAADAAADAVPISFVQVIPVSVGDSIYLRFATGLQTTANAYAYYIPPKFAPSPSYTLPTASETVLGGVKVGSGLSITGGTLSVSGTGGGGGGFPINGNGVNILNESSGNIRFYTDSGGMINIGGGSMGAVSIAPAGNVTITSDVGFVSISELKDPVNPRDAANKRYVDAATAFTSITSVPYTITKPANYNIRNPASTPYGWINVDIQGDGFLFITYTGDSSAEINVGFEDGSGFQTGLHIMPYGYVRFAVINGSLIILDNRDVQYPYAYGQASSPSSPPLTISPSS